jgi:hypothetical protein
MLLLRGSPSGELFAWALTWALKVKSQKEVNFCAQSCADDMVVIFVSEPMILSRIITNHALRVKRENIVHHRSSKSFSKLVTIVPGKSYTGLFPDFLTPIKLVGPIDVEPNEEAADGV